MAAEQNYAQALQQIAAMEKSGPYAGDVAALTKQWRARGSGRQATALYDAGKGEQALKILSDAGLTRSAIYSRMQAVLQAHKRANDALKTDRFDLVKQELNKILELESNNKNAYVREARTRLSPEFAKAMAQRLAEEADEAMRERRFAEARQKFDEALRLDSGNSAARSGMAELKDGAIWDYNTALQLIRKDPQKALALLNDVKDRLPPTDKFYQDAESRIQRITERLKSDSADRGP